MSKSEWKALASTHRRHMLVVAQDPGIKVSVIRVYNLNTEREQRVTVCRAFCLECRGFLQALIWRRHSPLNLVSDDKKGGSLFEMPEVRQTGKPAAPS